MEEVRFVTGCDTRRLSETLADHATYRFAGGVMTWATIVSLFLDYVDNRTGLMVVSCAGLDLRLRMPKHLDTQRSERQPLHCAVRLGPHG